MKSTLIKVLGNLDLRRGSKAKVVTSLDFDCGEKNITIGIQFVGRKKESEIFNFEEKLHASEICINTQRLYEALSDKAEKPAKRLEKISAQQIAENGILRLYGDKESDEPDMTIDLSFKTHIMIMKIPLYEIMNFVE